MKDKECRFVAKGIKDFNLEHIFDCGQCFRWTRENDGSYTGTAYGKIVNMSYDKDKEILTIYNATEDDYQNIWYEYLDLGRDYGKIKEKLCENDEVMKKASEYGYGIRLLKQEKWETLISFIISQNNNIPRIKSCIENLALNFGKKIGNYRGKDYYDLPDAEVLSSLSVDDLEPIKLGYRAKYLIETAKMLKSEGGTSALEAMSEDIVNTAEAFEYIRKYKGVGPKVANCILLFSMNKYDSFPIDVWVKRMMHQMYGINENDMSAMKVYAEEHFGEYGGFAQQYLFYYGRSL